MAMGRDLDLGPAHLPDLLQDPGSDDAGLLHSAAAAVENSIVSNHLRLQPAPQGLFIVLYTYGVVAQCWVAGCLVWVAHASTLQQDGCT